MAGGPSLVPPAVRHSAVAVREVGTGGVPGQGTPYPPWDHATVGTPRPRTTVLGLGVLRPRTTVLGLRTPYTVSPNY